MKKNALHEAMTGPAVTGQLRLTAGEKTQQRINTKESFVLQVKESKEKYRTLIEQAFDGIIIYSSAGAIIDFNESAAAYTGYSKEEFKQITIQDLFFRDDVSVRPLHLKKLKPGQSIIDHRKLKRKNGSSIEMEISTKVLPDGKLMAIARDITERNEAERQKEFDSNNLKALINNNHDLMWSVDRNLRLISSNKSFDEMMKQALGKPLKKGSNIFAIGLSEDKLGLWTEFYHRALTGESFTEIEYTDSPLPAWSEISFYPIINGDEVVGTACYSRNITERKLADEKIMAAKQRYEMVARATNDAIYEWNIMTNTIYWNESYETLFGHKRTGDVMPAASWIENLHPDERDKLLADTDDAFTKKLTSLTRELQFRCADGSYKIVFDKLVIQYDSNGLPFAIFGAMQDITECKRNETAIRELNEQLSKRAEELIASNAELERFAYVASHDLQEPLRMVSSFLQLLEKKYKSRLDETAEQYISYAVDGAERMKRLILDLLEYSRIGTSKEVLMDTDMGAVVAQVLETFSSKINDAGAVTKVQLMPVIKANKTQMTQLLQNLVSNSLKYNTSFVPEIEIGCEDKGDTWQFFIKDNGIGIESKFFDKVFVIFQRLHNKSRFSGTGIGLAVCKKIIERHGGTIWIESVAGEGSAFFFTVKK